MLATLGEFAQWLRRAGLGVGAAEVVDAASAAAEIDALDREQLRAALRATLCARREDVTAFEALFDAYFTVAGVRRRQGESLVDFRAEGIDHAKATLSPVAQALLGLRPIDIPALIGGQHVAWSLTGARQGAMQVGFYSYRLGRALDVDGAATAARALGAAEEEVAANVVALRQAIREFVTRELERERMAAVTRAGQHGGVLVRDLSHGDKELLEAEVDRIARALRVRMRRLQATRQRRMVDMGRTMRQSLTTDFIPMQLSWRRRPQRRPRLVVLCDVSDSVRGVSEFMLHLVYSLVDRFDRVDAYAFVSDLRSIGDLFRDEHRCRAVAEVLEGGVVNIFANSDYGRAFERFASRHMAMITKRTTVLILGDGRTNYAEPRAELVAEMRRRARHLYWLTPEARSLWAFGDCAMNLYEEHCDRVFSVRTVADLHGAVDGMFAGGTSA